MKHQYTERFSQNRLSQLGWYLFSTHVPFNEKKKLLLSEFLVVAEKEHFLKTTKIPDNSSFVTSLIGTYWDFWRGVLQQRYYHSAKIAL